MNKDRIALWVGLTLFVVGPLACQQPATETERPAARLVHLGVPESPRQARDAGCDVFGNNVGTGLSSLLLISGGVDGRLEPGRGGLVDVVVLAEVDGYEAGDAEPFDLLMYEGTHNESREFVSEAPLHPYQLEGSDGAFFADVTLEDDGWFNAKTDRLSLPIPMVDDFIVAATLSQTRLIGIIEADEAGVTISRGLLTGYVTFDEIMRLVGIVLKACGAEEQPIICELIGNQIRGDTPPEEAFVSFEGFMGGLDARLVDGVPSDCERDDEEAPCNAVSVCMDLEFEPLLIDGVRPTN